MVRIRPHESITKPRDAWVTKVLFDPIAVPLSYFFGKLGIHPNVITISSLLVSVLAFFLMVLTNLPNSFFLLYAFLFYLSFLLDCIDGKVARLTGKKSEFGAKLDSKTDNITKILFLVGYAVGPLKEFWYIALLIILLHYFLHYVFLYKFHLGVSSTDFYDTSKGRFLGFFSVFEEEIFMLLLAPLTLREMGIIVFWILSIALFTVQQLLLMKGETAK